MQSDPQTTAGAPPDYCGFYHVLIRRNADGLERLCRQDLDWFWTNHMTKNGRWERKDGAVYWWTDGNMGCDCARAQEFAQAGGEANLDVECSSHLYTAIKVVLPDGREILLDDAEDHEPYLPADTAKAIAHG